MKQIDVLFAEYAAFHRTRGNIVCHFAGIPLIILGILGFLRLLQVGPITGAEILILATSVFYFALDVRLAFAMVATVIALDLAAYAVSSVLLSLVAFVIGWILQAIGHAVYEKRSPAFARNLIHLLVGPIFILNEVLRVRVVTPAPGRE